MRPLRRSRRTAVPLLALACTLPPGCAERPTATDTAAEEPTPVIAERSVPPREHVHLSGRLLLPGEGDRRGVEVHAWVAPPGTDGSRVGEHEQLWIFPEPDGRFARDVTGTVTRVEVYATATVHRVDNVASEAPFDTPTVDLGVIDLRERLAECTVRVVDARGTTGGGGATSGGAVRVGLWIGEPPRGPAGGLPALGSIQFPTRAVGDDIAWLMPPDAKDVYFLVERPASPARTDPWFGGEQYVFGPYTSNDFPLELLAD